MKILADRPAAAMTKLIKAGVTGVAGVQELQNGQMPIGRQHAPFPGLAGCCEVAYFVTRALVEDRTGFEGASTSTHCKPDDTVGTWNCLRNSKHLIFGN
jgi:hypothetical protein